MKIALLILSIGIFCLKTVAQFSIQYPAAVESLNSCYDEGLLTVRIDIATASTNNNIVTIQLPPGVHYVPGSVAKTGGTASLTIGNPGGAPNAPTFELGPSSLSAGNFIIFTIQRNADCDARLHALNLGVFKDVVSVTGSAGTSSESNVTNNAYNVSFPSFSFLQPAAINNATIASSYTRSFSITNGADGVAENVYFYIVYPNAGITQNSLSLAGFGPISTSSVNGDTLFYNLTGAELGGDGLFTNGESLIFTEGFTLNECGVTTEYAAGWGCSNLPLEWCQSALGTGSVTMINGQGNLTSFVVTRAPGFVDMCGTGNGGFVDLSAVYTWTGTGNAQAASAYNVNCRIGGSSQATALQPVLNGVYSFMGNVTINGMSIPSTFVGGYLNIDIEDFFTVDPDGPGGLEDLDNDTFFDDLASGSTINLVYQITLDCDKSCGYAVSTSAAPAGDITYDNMCGTSITTQRKVGSSWSQSGWAANGYAPANIQANVPFNIRISTGIFTNTNMFSTTANTRFEYYLVLPPGVTVAGNVTWTTGAYYNSNIPAAITHTQSNDTVYIISPNSSIGFANLDVEYDCAAGGNATSLSMNYGLIQINNITTGCKCMGKMACGSLSMATSCPGACAAGPINNIPTVRRSDNSLGWTNANMTTRQLASNITAYDLSKAMFLDTIEFHGSAIQSNNASTYGLRLELTRPNGTDAISPIEIDYEIWRSGLNIAAGNMNSAASFDAGSVTTTQLIGWDLNAIVPVGGLLAGDSIACVSRYTVTAIAGLPLNDVQTGLNWYYYNDNAGTLERCNDFVPEFYLVGTSKLNANNTSNMYACTEAAPGGGTNYIARRFNTVGVKYQDEFRPAIYIDSIEVVFPTGYDFASATYNYTASYNTPAFSLNLLPTSTTANTLTFVNDGTWLPIGITVTNAYGATIPIRMTPNCETIPVEQITYNVYAKDYYYALANTAPYPSAHSGNILGKSNNLLHYNKGNVELSNQTGVIQAASPTESWTVRMENTGTGVAPYSWIAIPNHPNVTVTQVYDVTGAAVLTAIPYANGSWYQISAAGLSAGASNDIQIDFSYTSCSLDSLEVLVGWNCSGFPSDPTTYVCDSKELSLPFDPAISEIEIVSVVEPAGSVNLCTPAYYEYIVNNAQAGNSLNETFTIQSSTGLFVNIFEAEYPLGSNNWEVVTPAQTGNTYVYNLFTHSNFPVANGVPGTINALTSADRQVGVRFTMQTNCSFVANSNFSLAANAIRPCGQPAIGSSVPLTTSNINISGISASYLTVNVVDVDTLTNCSNNVPINIETTIVAGTTGNSGVIKIIVPSELTYISGSFSCSSAQCPTFISATTLTNGAEEIILGIPNGLNSGELMEYSINVDDKFNSSCGEKTVLLESIDQVSGIACPTEMSGVCGIVTYSTGFTSIPVFVNKPDIQITGSYGAGNDAGTNPIDLNLQIENLVNLNPNLGQDLQVDYYCLDAVGIPVGMPFATETISPSVQGLATVNHVTSLNATTCDINNGIGISVNQSNNCICDSTFTVVNLNITPVAVVDSTTTLEDVSVVIDVVDNDSDADGNIDSGTLTVSLDPINGTYTINTTSGEITYTPNNNFNGLDSLFYVICDDGSPTPVQCDSTWVYITVSPVNDFPSQGNENLTGVVEDDLTSTTSPNLTTNNIDPDGTDTEVTIILSTTGGGTVTINPSGDDVEYTPFPGFNGVDTVIYTVCDNGLPLPVECVNDTLFVTVNPVNDAPSQGNESMGPVVEDETTPATSPNLTTNNIDPDGTDTEVTVIVSSTGGGTVSINPNGDDVNYTPSPNFNGVDTVIYTVCDNGLPLPGLCVNDTLFVTISPVNDPPIVDNEFISVPVNGSNGGDLTDAGDIDIDGNLVVNTAPVDGPDFGGIVINPDGTFTYTPNPGYVGNDTVVVVICDDGTPTPIICVNDTIFITVLPTTPPVASPDSTVTNEDVAVTLNVTGDDTDVDGTIDDGTVDLDPGTVGVQTTFTSPEGTWTVDSNGDVTFTPNQDYNGDATITYTVNDDDGATSNTATLTVTVVPVNDPPLIDNENDTTQEDIAVSGDVTDAGDSDVDGSLVVNTIPIDDPNNGTIVINPDGTYTYTPNTNFNGVDTVVVVICDDGTPTPIICINDTIFITVTPVNDPPVNGNETVLTSEDTPVPGIDVVANNTDPEGDSVVVSFPNGNIGSGGGTFTDNGDGTVDYTPVPGFTGTDTLIYVVCDTVIPPGCVNDTIFVIVSPCDVAVATDDCDNDGLNNGEETTGIDDPNTPDTPNGNTSDPLNPDTDGDGVTDNLEGNDGTDPNDPCDLILASQNVTPLPLWWLTDCDMDGLTNEEEITGVDDPGTTDTPNGEITDPFNPDTDGDGVVDGTEGTDGTDPNDPCDFNEVSITVTVVTTVGCDLFVPEAFSPNGDGVNDLFVIEGLDKYPENEILILNRWGNKVYKSEGGYLNDWKGINQFGVSVGGDELPVGTYFYILDLGEEDPNGEQFIKGYIYMNR